VTSTVLGDVSVAAVALLLGGGSVQAQEVVHSAQESGSTVRSDARPPRFLAVDVLGGFVEHGRKDTRVDHESLWKFKGWEAGGNVRFIRWLGAAGTVARTTDGDRRLWEYLAGPQFSTCYCLWGAGAARAFAHTLVGTVSASSPNLPAEHRSELVIGGGFDVPVIYLRLQFDYLRSGVSEEELSPNGLQQNTARAFVGVVVPLCFRQCRAEDVDGIQVRK